MEDYKVDSRLIKMHNRMKIYEYIWENGPVSRQDISIGLRVSLPTVTHNLNFLEEQGLIDTSDTIRNTGGRSATAYKIAGSARCAIGISLTGHHMNAVSMNILGEIGTVLRQPVVFDMDSDDYFKKIGETVEKIMEADAILPERLLGVGISLPGLVSEDGEVMTYGKTLGFTGKTRAEICKYVPYPNRLFHDAKTACYAEMRANRNLKDAFYIMLSNTVGGAMIHNGELYEGENRRAGDICHMIVDIHSKKRCYCGKTGCFETICNADQLVENTDGNLADFFQRLKEGDKEASKRWGTFLNHLAVGIHNVRMLCDMKVVIGGYVGPYMDDYMDDIVARVDALEAIGTTAADYLIPCASRKEPIAAGAARIFIDEFVDSISQMGEEDT